jgi:hypothetical protein
MPDACTAVNCEYNTDGICTNCGDLYNPEEPDKCVAFVDVSEGIA